MSDVPVTAKLPVPVVLTVLAIAYFFVGTTSLGVIGQVVEGNFLSPKLVGGSVGLHPVWLMFSLSALSTKSPA